MDLRTVHQGVHRRKRRKRLGRGPSSGHGKTATRGHKGQRSRAGTELPHILFEGGQMPLARRIPKRGFHNRFRKVGAEVNVGDLQRHFQDGDRVDEEALRRARLLRGSYDYIKILGDGPLTKKLTVVADRFSKSAEQKILAAGGTVLRRFRGTAEPATAVSS
jgi:large subunit ribosomal protein L15